jgi:hypothetical protein
MDLDEEDLGALMGAMVDSPLASPPPPRG